MATRKPNLLLIQADQLAPQFLAEYGHPLVKTPSIDRLAEQEVVFDSAYTNAPLCAPSRFVMMSGRLPSRIAAWDNAVEFSSEIPTFAHYLSAEGYRTCLSGKMHFIGPDQLHGFGERLTTDVYPLRLHLASGMGPSQCQIGLVSQHGGGHQSRDMHACDVHGLRR